MPEEYTALLAMHNGCCAICREPFTKIPRIDHDHETGAVRGLLCQLCNTGLGMFQDSPRLLAAAIIYLEDSGKTY